MKSSCVTHPTAERLIIIRAWQVEACGGNHCAAALLSFFEYWHNIRLESSEKAHQSNAVAEKHGDEGKQDTSLYQFHTAAQLMEGLCELYAEDTIRKALAVLVKLEFITISKNPNPRYAFDATKHFLFHPENVNKYLEARCPKNQTSYPKNRQRSPKNPDPSTENPIAIHEITSEITSKEEGKKRARAPVAPACELDLAIARGCGYVWPDIGEARKREIKAVANWLRQRHPKANDERLAKAFGGYVRWHMEVDWIGKIPLLKHVREKWQRAIDHEKEMLHRKAS